MSTDVAAPTMPPSTRYYVAFNQVAGIGPARLAQLIETCGSIEAAWHADPAAMDAAGLDRRTMTAFEQTRASLDLDTLMQQLAASDVTLLTIDDAAYPRLLRAIDTPPPLLYVRGALHQHDEWAVAIVGTRKVSTYGREVTRTLVSDLARSGITIVSGLAGGVDSIAHQAALDAGGRTLAVFGTGIDIIYPHYNRALADRIMPQGALISDFAPGTRPAAANFPARNRIISGLSLATLVIEAGVQSGALITARFANEQGRDVFAVPGSILSPSSAGTNRLLRDGAGVVTCAEDILEALNLHMLQVQQQVATELLLDDPTEAAVMAELSAEPRHIDAIARACGLPAATVAATLTMLELKGFVRTVGTMEYVRARH